MWWNLQGDSGGALTTEEGVLVGLVSAAGSDQCGKVMLQYLSSLCFKMTLKIWDLFVRFKTTFTGKCLRPVYRDCCIHNLDQRDYIEDGRHAGLWSCVWGDKPRRSFFPGHICHQCCLIERILHDLKGRLSWFSRSRLFFVAPPFCQQLGKGSIEKIDFF